MISLKNRSYKKELLDGDNIPFADIKQNMKELNTVNSLLGGHQITISGLKNLLPDCVNKTITICEIGCGGGDNLHAIEKWCEQKNITVRFIGIDIKEECIAFAKQQYPSMNATWIVSDYAIAGLSTAKPDIIFSSLFCHHFNDNELTTMLKWMQENCSIGFFINDLERNIFAYHSIKIITSIFSKSYLVKNDAPLSVARGFKKEEWLRIFESAGIKEISIKWKWAFRFLIVYRHGRGQNI